MFLDGSDLQIIPTGLFEQYIAEFDKSLQKDFESLKDSDLSISTFSFYISVSAVFSSKIEGENIELDSFIKHKRFGTKYLPDYTRKIDDIYEAYLFAQQNHVNAKAIEEAHSQITKHILQKSRQGKFRTGNMFVVTKDGNIEYAACAPGKVKSEMNKLYADIELLLTEKLSFEEVFFFASMIHLVFVKIHPYEDGNGRTSRLIEKWFISEKLGTNAWFLQSERHYYNEHRAYYENIRKLGLEYEELKFMEALPFLQMLPKVVRNKSSI